MRRFAVKAICMQAVYAYRDNGPMLAFSRWKPRRVFCTNTADDTDQPPAEHVVKFRQGAAGTAGLISEVVCGSLLSAAKIPALDRRLVDVSLEFAISCRFKQELPYTVVEGGFGKSHQTRKAVRNRPNRATCGGKTSS
jgi:hypothetical protein